MLPEEELLIQRSTSVSAESSKPVGRGSLMMRYPKTAHVTACRDFLELKVSRRRSLQAGALALTGLGLPGLLRAREPVQQSGPNGFGRAKSCILIFLWGGPSQLDTWDPKPAAPEDIRGSFRADPDGRPGDIDQRALSAAGPAGAPAVDRAIDEPRRPGRTSRRPTAS